jgi:hypothetical protein
VSIEALNAQRQQRKYCTENGYSSEQFEIVGGVFFYGTFDKSHIEEKNDSGNVQQKNIYPRIMVDSMPDGLQGNVTKIIRVSTGLEYTFSFYGTDLEGIGLVWLY